MNLQRLLVAAVLLLAAAPAATDTANCNAKESSCTAPVTGTNSFALPSPIGGWDPQPVFPELLHEAERCDVEVRHGDGALVSFLAKQAAKAGPRAAPAAGARKADRPHYFPRPLIFRGVKLNAGLAAGSLSKAQMLSQFCHRQVELSAAETYSHTRKYESFCDYILRRMLRDVWEGREEAESEGEGSSSYLPERPRKVREVAAHPAEDTWYLCGSNFWEDVIGSYDQVPHLAGAAVAFGIGRSASGVPPHKHGPAYLHVLTGAKRWFLAPPETNLQFNPRESTLQWWLRMSDAARERGESPHEQLAQNGVSQCVQQVGDILYSPDDWWHATLNIGETVFFLSFV